MPDYPSHWPKIQTHQTENNPFAFRYRGLTFSQQHCHLFAGLNTVDDPSSVEQVMKSLSEFKLKCTRMGAYKPRSSPYTFQGHGEHCLPYVFELAGKYGIEVIAMEVTHEQQVETIYEILERLGHPTGVMLQIGTRNVQNFELLKAVGKQQTFPILFKRGFGITLEESLLAAEYIAKGGNERIIFCLRGLKSLFAPPHRNMVDFSQIPALQRMIKLPIGIDPSHAVGTLESCPNAIPDILHNLFQGVACGANLVLLDIHPNPEKAYVDAQQTLSLNKLPWILEELTLAWSSYKKRLAFAKQHEQVHEYS